MTWSSGHHTALWKGFLIDLDGTMYHGPVMIPGADKLITEMNRRNIPLLFVTNNSSKTPEEVAEQLRRMGIPASHEQVCTSAVAAASHLAEESPGCKVAAIGENGLVHALENAGLILTDEEPEYVVQGIDRSFNYETLTRAARWIHGGAKYVLTNPDLLLPSDEGLMPGAGSLSAAIQAATAVEPLTIGKPSAILMKQAMDRLGLPAEQVAVIGDNMLTDISAGDHAGCGTILTLTGVTTEGNLEYYLQKTGITPDLVCENLDNLLHNICP
ncbi:TIGR01457 family HAD-type hydrolase [Paenibacillus sp. CAA11]|uniref:TIGR01457 family HAD-type hydrolase n=1 Tax=Paenibacillus sp. CAA11 TaxID=1532905 RepID=UPI000D3B3CD6|nr:TIGR01457 family HAD-type hydrolase [Paenibacillus sp. CAA11]AWB44867.1 TIGR01457 family HAD-type hydrolase [Paenibacillus sp. CAA11]